MNVLGVVQARMGSTRLPRKVLLNILGKPMLLHLLERLARARNITTVMIAATVADDDVLIQDFCERYKYDVYRGSVDDIVDRFYQAAKTHNGDMIVRVWGDCPLIDPAIVDDAIDQFIDSGADYANNFKPPTFPHGMNFEIYAFSTLERIWNGTEDPFYREYPFEFIYANKDEFKTLFVTHDTDLSGINLTVDYQADLDLVTSIFTEYQDRGFVFGLEEILKFLEAHPELMESVRELRRNIEYKEDLKKRSDIQG